jgi:3-oxoacyl-[acyl-carrier-protein] synthase II
LSARAIGYLNAHATSTKLGDPIELQAIAKLFGAHARELAISSTKGATGHMLGAAGAIEAMFAIQALRDGVLPPTLNLEEAEDSLGLNLVPRRAMQRRVRYVLSNSCGFGGTNAALIFARV